MSQKKLARFAELNSFPNVLQFPENTGGNWHKFFGNNHPVTLELACGKGEYALGLARLHPKRNFIGIDIKGNRLWVGARNALGENLSNVAFLRISIDHITEYFSEGEVAEIWITFPDPQPRLSKAKKRLTHPRFLRFYSRFLAPGGRIHLKTDSPELHDFSRKVIQLCNCTLYQDIEDLYASGKTSPELSIRTYYESLDIAASNRIHYLSFSLPPVLPGREVDEKLKQLYTADEKPD